MNEEIYKPLKNVTAVEYNRKVHYNDEVKSHLSSLLPLTVNVEKVFDSKLKNKALSLATEKATHVTANVLNSRKAARDRGQNKTMSSREKKQRGLFRLPRYGLRFSHYIALNELWQQYLLEIVGNTFTKFVGEEKLLKADFHGSFIVVTQSLNPDLIGMGGLVLQETQETFKIITPMNTVKSINKRGSVFQIDISFFTRGLVSEISEKTEINKHDDLLPFDETLVYKAASDPQRWYSLSGSFLTVFGDQCMYRAIERHVRRFKATNSVELGVK